MSEILTMQDLANGHLDIKALGEAANGDENTIVTTRTGNTYPSAERAINIMFQNGGLPAEPFATKALMTASSLPNGSYAVVTNDADGSKNLVYVKTGDAWETTKYNPSELAKEYAESISKNLAENNGHLLDVYEDREGNAYRYTDKNGNVYIPNMPITGSIQDNFSTINSAIERVPDFDATNNILTILDSNENIAVYIDDQSRLNISNDILINNESVLDKLGSAGASQTDLDRVRYTDVLMHRYPAIKNLTTVAPIWDGTDYLTKRMPTGIVTPTGMVLFHHQQIDGFSGDADGSEIWKAIITIADDLTVTVDSRTLFLSPDAPRGIVKHPMLCRTSDNRILLVYEKRLETSDPYVRYQCYSSDEGVTFTSPTISVFKGSNPAGSGNSALGTTGTIATARDGRLILPMYTTTGKCFAAYSDDDGVTWAYGSVFAQETGDEPSITPDMNDDLIMDIRPRVPSNRIRAKSTDNGLTWKPLVTEPVMSAINQGVLFRDKSIGAMFQTHNENNLTNYHAVRSHFTISVSFDNAQTYSYKYKPYADSWYGGYSQLLKWKDGIYILVIEYDETFVSVNSYENTGIILLSIKEVLTHVRNN